MYCLRSNLVTSAILQLRASPILMAYSTARLLTTGNVPGSAIETGSTTVFGSFL